MCGKKQDQSDMSETYNVEVLCPVPEDPYGDWGRTASVQVLSTDNGSELVGKFRSLIQDVLQCLPQRPHSIVIIHNNDARIEPNLTLHQQGVENGSRLQIVLQPRHPEANAAVERGLPETYTVDIVKPSVNNAKCDKCLKNGLEVLSTDTGEAICQKVAHLRNVPPEFVLYHNDRVIASHQTMQEHGVTNGSVLKIGPKPTVYTVNIRDSLHSPSRVYQSGQIFSTDRVQDVLGYMRISTPSAALYFEGRLLDPERPLSQQGVCNGSNLEVRAHRRA